jgi:hypothetical protein
MIQLFQHTPGPWEINTTTGYTDVIATANATERVCMIDGEGDKDLERTEANARLIAAAPAMLDALVLAQRALNAAPRFRVGDTDSYRTAAVVDRAIATATAA